ncbi:MAG: MucR family transcriptional regulator, partial [Alphaproteobacteria bacterium]|nr:MucR family transcriptional regulator [Alphaproteobacteria bacterium]
MAETSETDIGSSELLQLTSDIVAAHVSNNSVPSSELSGLIEQVYRTLEQVGKGP